MTDVREQYAIPYFGDVPVPPGLSDVIRRQIDTTGDGVINWVDEAWTAYRLAKQKTGVGESDRNILTRLSRRFTQVNFSRRAIRVFGHRFNVVVAPDQVTPKNWDPQCTMCLSAVKLFYVGEALRSFGRPMVARWARGGRGELPLTLVLAEPGATPTATLSDLGEKFRMGTGLARRDLSVADGVYFPQSNVLTVDSIIDEERYLGSLYKRARHELGHAVDDWLHPGDIDRPAWETSFYSIKLLTEGMYPSPAEALPRFYGTYRFDGLVFDGSPPEVSMASKVCEGFAVLFENVLHWREESPVLLRTVHCFLRGGTARSCWIE